MFVRRVAPLVLTAALLVACAENSDLTAPAESVPVAYALEAGSVCPGAAMPEIQCEALVALYNATNGADWYIGNWATEPDPCAWFRVSCNPDGTVRRLDLYQNNLSGQIPSEIGDLSDLVELRLWGNAITGPIPARLGDLTNLEVLVISSNAIAGSIPGSLANLTRATYIAVGNNQLTGTIPVWLASLPDLEVLLLDGNQFSGGIPVELAALPRIKELNLGRNDLTGAIPAAFGATSTLQLLFLHRNQLSGSIPPELGGLSQLRSLGLDDNQLTGPIPAELGNLGSLDIVYLQGNQLSGLVPLEFAELGSTLFVCWIGSDPGTPGNEGLYMPDVEAYRAADLDGDGKICNLPFATAEDIGEDAVGAIDDLVPDPLNAGVANALTSKIANAVAKAANGQYQAAINQMQAFLAQLGDMVANGTLTPAEAAPLIEQAEWLISMWMEML
jgi:Leucine-rich repeat (LRR) protein